MITLLPLFRTIPLYNQKREIIAYALVDESDHDYLLGFGSWYMGDRYPQIVDKTEAKHKTYLMHVVLWKHWGLTVPKGMMIDHKDRQGTNNQRANLRLATPQQNSANSTPQAHRRFKGVKLDTRGKRYRYQTLIRYNGRLLHVGMYDTEVEAAAAYNAKALELFGEFAYLNPIPHPYQS